MLRLSEPAVRKCDVYQIIKYWLIYTKRILHEYSCFIEFIKLVGEKRSNVRLAKHFISFSKEV